MGNFDFVRATTPALFESCSRAESYLTTDPRSACFYARRAVEGLVAHLYGVLELPEAYRDDLAARLGAAPFQRRRHGGADEARPHPQEHEPSGA